MIAPTDEQRAILSFATSRSENLLISALAGTGKTSTLEMAAAAIVDRPILYLAFNKRIVDEAKLRMPPHVECRTQNSLGHNVWSRAIARRLVVDPGKTRTIFRAVVADLPRRQQEEAWEDASDTYRWVSRAKRDGWVPETFTGPCERLYPSRYEWLARYDDRPTTLQWCLIEDILLRSITASYEGGIDYDDQVYMPTVFGGPWPRFPLVVVDEVQDYNPLGHEMLAKLVPPSGRLIAVGDPWQSIYAFRGAMYNGMSALQDRFRMEELPLSTTFRVPKIGVSRANERVPAFSAHPSNPEGTITIPGPWGAADVPPTAAIICRNNAPLLSLAFRLLRDGRAVKLLGFDIGANLVRTLRKLGPPTLGPDAIAQAITNWITSELNRGRREDSVFDRADCLRALTDGSATLGDAIVRADILFKREGPIHLMSGHKAKGLEYDVVLHLDPWRIPSKYAAAGTEAYEQELNVRYVIETRFKKELYLVNLEDYHGMAVN